MSWRPHGRAEVDPTAPRAWATCDSCGFNYNLKALNWDRQWAGAQIINKNFLVCDICLDVPQEQLRTFVLPPDPMPIFNARVEQYAIDETDFRVTNDASIRTTQDGADRVTQSSQTEATNESTG